MSVFDDGRQRARLADMLKRLRLAAGLTGYKLAERLEVDQSTVSRIERNQQRASLRLVTLWCDITEASKQQRAELLTLAEDVLAGPRRWEEVGETGSTNFQHETQELEAKAKLLGFYQPAILPGLLQTATYARRVFSSGPAGVPADIAERVLGRMERQRVLYDDSKRLRFVVPEAVLRWPVGPPAEHAEQLDRLGEIMHRPNIDLRILPMTPVSTWRAAGFVLFAEISDADPFVHLELLTGPVNIDEPGQVAAYIQVYDNLLKASAAGQDAQELLDEALHEARRSYS